MASSFPDQIGQGYAPNTFHHVSHMVPGTSSNHSMYASDLLYYEQMSMMPIGQVPPASSAAPPPPPPPPPSESTSSPFHHQDIATLGSYLMLGYEPTIANVNDLEPYYYPSAFHVPCIEKQSNLHDMGSQSPNQSFKKESTSTDVSKMFESFYSTPTGEFKPCFYNPFEVKHRKRTSRSQFKVLEKAFQENSKPAASVRRALASKVGMTSRGVQVWFQNRRAKLKVNVSKDEVDSAQEESKDSQGLGESEPVPKSHETEEEEEEEEDEDDDEGDDNHASNEASGFVKSGTELENGSSDSKSAQECVEPVEDKENQTSSQAKAEVRQRSKSSPDLSSLKNSTEKAALAHPNSESAAPTLGILTFTNGSQVYNDIKPFRDQRFPSTSGLDLALKRIGKGVLMSPEWTSQMKGPKMATTGARRKSRVTRKNTKQQGYGAPEMDSGSAQMTHGELASDYAFSGAQEKKWPNIAPAFNGHATVAPVSFLPSNVVPFSGSKAMGPNIRRDSNNVMLSPSLPLIDENMAVAYDTSQCSSFQPSSGYYTDQYYFSSPPPLQPPHPSSLPQWHIPYDSMSQFEQYGRPRAVSMPLTLYSGFQGNASGQLGMSAYSQQYTSGL